MTEPRSPEELDRDWRNMRRRILTAPLRAAVALREADEIADEDLTLLALDVDARCRAEGL